VDTAAKYAVISEMTSRLGTRVVRCGCSIRNHEINQGTEINKPIEKYYRN
jgi:hypothetical protein